MKLISSVTRRKNNRFWYCFINTAVLACALIVFGITYQPVLVPLFGSCRVGLLSLFFTVLGVHIIKALRLYLAMYGNPVNTWEYLKTYCKVTPVSLLLPYKLGEFFRMYCYGVLLKDFWKGTIIVLLDRFMDLSALVTWLLILGLLAKSSVGLLVCLFLFVMAVLLGAYFIFPGFYTFWKNYYLAAVATPSTLRYLKYLDVLAHIHRQVKSVVQGRGIILYALSVLAWGMELINLWIVSKSVPFAQLTAKITSYLSAALTNGPCPTLREFVALSIVLLAITYVLLQVGKLFFKREKIYENNYLLR